MIAAFRNLRYYQKKSTELEARLKEIEGHDPDLQDLCVMGVGITQANSTEAPSKSVATEPEVSEDSRREESTIQVSLTINGRTVGGRTKIFVRFNYDVPQYPKLSTEHLRIENSGKTALRFYWKQLEHTSLLRGILPFQQWRTFFYFDKNEAVLLPGQTVEFPVSFKSAQPGRFAEYWELRTRPEVSTVMVTMQADAFITNMREKREEIRNKIEIRTGRRDRQEVTPQPDNPVVYRYNLRETFEAVNSNFDPLHQKLRYKYDPVIVGELKEFYQEVRREHDPLQWSYRIDDLEVLARARQVQPRLEGILDRLEEGEGSFNSKKDRLYMDAYLIMRTCFNKICEALEDLQDGFGVICVTKYPRLVLERDTLPPHLPPAEFCAEIISPPLRERFGKFTDRPAAETLKEIPKEEVEKRWRIYYNIVVEKPMGKGKGKGLKAKKPKKEKKGKGKKEKGKKVEVTQHSVVTESCVEFDPYADVPPNSEILVDEELDLDASSPYSNAADISPPLLEQYRHSMHVIVYSHLKDAILTIVDMFEINSTYRSAPPACVKEAETTKHFRCLENADSKDDRAEEVLRNLRRLSKKDQELEDFRSNQRADIPSTSSSMWSILQPYKRKPRLKIPCWKPISYPEDHYHVTQHESRPPTANVTTSVLDSKIDPDWQDFKDVSTQEDYYIDVEDEDDVVAQIEGVVSVTTAEASTTEELYKHPDYVCSEERFYGSDEAECNCEVYCDCKRPQ